AMYRRAFLLLLLLVTTLPTAVAARSLVIERFDADVVVSPEGVIYVTETIRPRFTGEWNGIFRTIPVEYRTPQGFNYTLHLDVESIADERGNPLKVEQSRERHYRKFKIWVPDARDATRTVVFRYRVSNALKFFEAHDELYWNITGDEWEVPIQSAAARILLPPGASGVRALAFTGAYGSREQRADVEIAHSEVRVRMRRSLAFREGMTVVVGWDKGLVKEPGPAAKAALFLHSNWVFLIPLGAFGLMFSLWHTRGRDPRRRPIVPRYEPPEDLTPAELGTLMDNSSDMRDITATVVDLAVRGYLLIEEKEEARLLGLWSDKDYIFTLRKELADWGELKPHEAKLLNALFARGSRTSVELSDLENRFYKDLPEIHDRIFDRLLARRYYTQRPDKVRKVYLFAGAVISGITIWGGTLIAHLMGLAPLSFIVAGILTAVPIIGFGWFMPARTLMGARALEGVLGFEEFLSRVEADRLDRTIKTPEMFEKYLPYAMALGVENNWVRAFEDIYRQRPEWYRGTDGASFHPRSFVSDLGRMSSQAASAMASAPRSSGGSGFGGGGSSGGGRGGGGGGGF
ncbi:MAG: DUF2207 domain-containing protein, partial [Candidatus Methylomirabilales bacterium]